jgi:hypothetical protein
MRPRTQRPLWACQAEPTSMGVAATLGEIGSKGREVREHRFWGAQTDARATPDRRFRVRSPPARRVFCVAADERSGCSGSERAFWRGLRTRRGRGSADRGGSELDRMVRPIARAERHLGMLVVPTKRLLGSVATASEAPSGGDHGVQRRVHTCQARSSRIGARRPAIPWRQQHAQRARRSL